MKTNPFEKYFYPKTVCIAGASSKPFSLGFELTKTVIGYGYKGKLLLVNPKAEEILGVKCFKDIQSVSDEIDLAIVMVPKAFAENTIQQLIDKEVVSIILITAGFKETGKEGEEAEKRIIDLIKKHNVRLVGPNCMGIINTLSSISLNATFVAEKPETGKMAFCSQSGAIGAAVLNSLRETDIRFAHFISVGNKADVNENDLLLYWQSDDNINVITYYLESFVDGEGFIKNFIDGCITKPVIILKAGKTSSGMKAASSHTGAMGSSDKVVDAIIKQFGLIRAETLNDLFNTAKGFENFPSPKGNRVAVLTNAGGPAILTVDTLEKNNLKLAELTQATRAKLKEIVHPEGSVNNPVDLLPGGTAEQYKLVNEILAGDPNVDAVISVFVEPVMVKALPVIEGINSIRSDKPILQVVMPLPEFWQEYREKSMYKLPLFRNPEEPAVVISDMFSFTQNNSGKKRLNRRASLYKNDLSKYSGQFLPQAITEEFAKLYKLPVIESMIVKNGELESLNLNFPVVIKAVGEKLIHKSEFNAVRLNIKNNEELLAEAEEILQAVMKNDTEAEGFLIQPFIKPKFELLVGGFRDSNFGPMVMFGTGGKYVEYYEDTSIRSAYLCDDDIDEMINSTKIGRIIKGVRGEKPVDIQALKEVIKNLSQMMLDNYKISECDLNPLLVSENNKMYAVDVRIKLG